MTVARVDNAALEAWRYGNPNVRVDGAVVEVWLAFNAVPLRAQALALEVWIETPPPDATTARRRRAVILT